MLLQIKKNVAANKKCCCKKNKDVAANKKMLLQIKRCCERFEPRSHFKSRLSFDLPGEHLFFICSKFFYLYRVQCLICSWPFLCSDPCGPPYYSYTLSFFTRIGFINIMRPKSANFENIIRINPRLRFSTRYN